MCGCVREPVHTGTFVMVICIYRRVVLTNFVHVLSSDGLTEPAHSYEIIQ